MFWRILVVIGGLTFLAGGCQVLGDENCNSVDIGGNRRVMSFECHRSPRTGEFSGSTAGALGVAIGSAMILAASWPLVRVVQEWSRRSTSGASTYKSSSSSASEPRREQARVSNQPRDPPSSSRSWFCTQCGSDLRKGIKFCGACGQEVHR